MSKNSHEINVDAFRTILFLPLIWKADSSPNLKTVLGEEWTKIEILREHLPDKKGDDFYAEYNYFHDFVQDFLYNDKEAITLYERNDIEALSIGYHCFKIDRLRFYYFQTGVAFLVMEFSNYNNEYFTLANIQNINEKIRRVFPPHMAGNSIYNGLHFITQGKTIDSKDETDQTFKERLIKSNVVPLMAAWTGLFPDNFMDKWRHSSDDRMPIMSFINLKNGDYKTISDGDWYRLAFVDGAGDGLPYSKDFLDKLEVKNFYDRYHETFYNTRYCISGYSFTLATESDFTEQHFRRHYFQMFMLANFEQQSLLRFSSRMTEAVKHKHNFRESMSKIQSDFLDFTHRFRFTGITGQLQGIELNALIRKQMGLDELYKDVKEEIASSNSYLSSESTRKQTEATLGLTYFAAIAAIASISIAFASMSLLFGDNVLDVFYKIDKRALIIGRIALLTGCFAFVTGIAAYIIKLSKIESFKILLNKLLCASFLFVLTTISLAFLQIITCSFLVCW